MKIRALLFAFLALILSSNAHAVFISEEISTTDDLALDPDFGDFFYDLFFVSVDFAMTIEIFVEAQDAFAPYVAYWDGDFSPAPNWFAPPPVDDDGTGLPEDTLYIKFDALPGINYQLMVSTFEFNQSDGTPADMGSYFLWVTNPPRIDTGINVGASPFSFPTPIPAPASVLLLGIGLLIMSLIKRYQLKLGQLNFFQLKNNQVRARLLPA